MIFAFNMWKQSWWSLFDIMNGVQSPIYFLKKFVDHNLYKFMWFLAIM